MLFREIRNGLFFIPDMIAGRNDINTVGQKFSCRRFSNTETGGGIFSIGCNYIYFVPANEIGEERLDGLPPRFPDNISYKEDFHYNIRSELTKPTVTESVLNLLSIIDVP